MGNPTIANFLKQLRKASGKSIDDVVKALEEYGLATSPKTIYGYENCVSTPNADTFMMLCKIYNCDNPVELIYGASFTASESEILEKFRYLDNHGKQAVTAILDVEYERCKETSVPRRIYTYLHKIAAAGTGFYLDDIPTDFMEVPEIPGADFLIGVNGDSMEPTFHDGDIVYVERTNSMNYGEIGIFLLNGEYLIKEYAADGLVSHNSKYPLIKGSADIKCIGRVLGKVEE